ncbi:segregation/condensation protein A [Streptomyces sp. 7R016]|uniref:Segregation and condensation protein A n=1 Tax=Streptomyces spinosisporus TaxID=2927582 RepID=A0ABS9XNB1_9ACTN|nr:segregation/condensation protein A [Streptomyces spinosisporus]
MTSNDAPTPSAGPPASGSRRRALGRGPGTAPTSTPPEPHPTGAPVQPDSAVAAPELPAPGAGREVGVGEGGVPGDGEASEAGGWASGDGEESGGVEASGGSGGPDGAEGPRDGAEPGGGEASGDGEEPEDVEGPREGAEPGDGEKSGDGGEPGGSGQPGVGEEPDGVEGPRGGEEPDDGEEPGDGVEPGDGEESGDGGEPGGSGQPGAGDEPDGVEGSRGGEEPDDGEEPGGAVEPGGGEESGDGVFKVRLANFEGPFDLLLQLISKHKLDVTEVALSKVTDEFMAHIRAMGPDWDLDQTTEFLVVAATLLDLKAARLLPSAEVEDEADLALLEARDLLFARLLQYRAYKQIADIFNRRLDEEARRYPRTVGLEPHHAELLPEVVISIGPEGFAKLAVKAMQPKPKPQVYVDHIHAPLVSVQEQARIVIERLKESGEVSFRALVDDTEDTLTVVARFLALLELYREKAVALDQETGLGELMVRWTGGEGEAQPMVTDEFDRPPEPAKEEQKA